MSGTTSCQPRANCGFIVSVVACTKVGEIWQFCKILQCLVMSFFLDHALKSHRWTDFHVSWFKQRVSHKEGSAQVYIIDEWRHLGKHGPQNPLKVDVNKALSGQNPKITIGYRGNYKSDQVEILRWSRNHQLRCVGGLYHYSRAIPSWLTVTVLKIGMTS